MIENSKVKLQQVSRIMEKLDIEEYYNLNLRIVLAGESYPFLADLETFLDKCARERAEIDLRNFIDDELERELLAVNDPNASWNLPK